MTADREGKPQTVRYKAINAMLLSEFLKEYRKVEAQQAIITELRSLVAQQQKEFEATIGKQRNEFEACLQEQEAKIQRVNDWFELTKHAPRIVSE